MYTNIYSLDDEGFGVESKRAQEQSRDGVMFGSGLQYKAFITRQLCVFHLLNLPFT